MASNRATTPPKPPKAVLPASRSAASSSVPAAPAPPSASPSAPPPPTQYGGEEQLPVYSDAPPPPIRSYEYDDGDGLDPPPFDDCVGSSPDFSSLQYSHLATMKRESSAAESLVLSLLSESVKRSDENQAQQAARRRDVYGKCVKTATATGTSLVNTTAEGPLFVDELEGREDGFRRAPVVSLGTSCYIFTTASTGKKVWIKSLLQLHNHSLIITDDDVSVSSARGDDVDVTSSVSELPHPPQASSSSSSSSQHHQKRNSLEAVPAIGGGGSKRGQRLYSLSKGGDAKIVAGEFEGRQHVMFVSCVLQSRSKHISFPSSAVMNQWQSVLTKYFAASPSDLATLQAAKLMSLPVINVLQLSMPFDEADRPEEDLYKSAKVCAATGQKLGMFAKPSRCDNCGNGFAADQVRPKADMPHLVAAGAGSDNARDRASTGAGASKDGAAGSFMCCFKCDDALTLRENTARQMEDALETRDVPTIVKLLSVTSSTGEPILSPDFSSSTGLTPLLVAVTDTDAAAAEVHLDAILALRVDVNARAYALERERKATKATKFLGANPIRQRRLSSVGVGENRQQISGVTALMAATMLDRQGMIHKLISKGADPTIVGDSETHHTPLSFAAANDSVVTLTALCALFGGIQSDKSATESAAPSVPSSPQAVASSFVLPSIDFRAVGSGRRSALNAAVRNNSLKAARLLLEFGTAYDIDVDDNLETPLHVAAALGFDGAIELLCDFDKSKTRFLLAKRDARGDTPLQTLVNAYAESKVSEVAAKQSVKSLMSRGASICSMNFSGKSCISLINGYNGNLGSSDADIINNVNVSPLTIQLNAMGYAIRSNRWDEVTQLLDNGNFTVDYLSRASDFLTPLASASKLGNGALEAAKLLLNRGADPLAVCGDDMQDNAICVAAYHGQNEVLELLLSSRGGIKERECLVKGNYTPLSRTVSGAMSANSSTRSAKEKEKSIKCIKYLLGTGCDPLHFDDDGLTPLYLAVQSRDIDLAKCFVEFAKNKDLRESFTTVGALFSLDAPHVEGITPLMLAAKSGSTDICTLLVEGGASIDARDIHSKSVLTYAVSHGQTSSLKYLIGKASYGLLRSTDTFGASLLHGAAAFLQKNPLKAEEAYQIVSILLDSGVDATCREYEKRLTALEMIRNMPNNESKPAIARVITLFQAMDSSMHAKKYSEMSSFIERGNYPVDWVCSTNGVSNGLTSLIVASGDDSDAGHNAIPELIKLGAGVNFHSSVLVSPFEGAIPAYLTPLLAAVMAGNVQGAELLLQGGARLGAVPVSGEGGSFILMSAVQSRRIQLVQMLLASGVDSNLKTRGLSPLLMAASCGDLDICTELVDHGASVNMLHDAESCRSALKMLNKLFVLESYFAAGTTPMMLAALNAKADVVKFLLSQGASISATDSKGRVALHYAAQSGDTGCIKILFAHAVGGSGDHSRDTSFANLADKSNRTVFMDACGSGNAEAVQFLLDAGADPSAIASDGVTCPLSEALGTNKVDVIAAIDAALSRDDTCINNGDLEPFIERVKRKAAPVDYDVRLTLTKTSRDTSTAKKRTSSLLQFGSSSKNLLEGGAANVSKDLSSVTALVKACEMKNAKWIDELVKLGADVNKSCSGGATPNDCPVLVCARLNDVSSLQALLKSSNGRVNTNSVSNMATPLSLAVQHDNGELVRTLLDSGANPLGACSNMGLVDFKNSIDGSDESSPLHLASATGRIKSLQEMLSGKVRHNIDTQLGANSVTALMAAANGGHLVCVQALCKSNADVRAKDRLGRTAAHYAAASGHVEVIVILCGEYGASASAKDVNNLNVAETAKDKSCIASANMAIAGEASAMEVTKMVVAESDKKVARLQQQLDQCVRDLIVAQGVIAGIENGRRDVTLAQRLVMLVNAVTSPSLLKEADLKKLLEVKLQVKKADNAIEQEVTRRVTTSVDLITCMVCKENERNCVLIPCKHLACCERCATNPRFRSCPICLSRVDHFSPGIQLRAPEAVALAVDASSSAPFAPVVVVGAVSNDMFLRDRSASGRMSEGDVVDAESHEAPPGYDDGVTVARMVN